MHERVGVVCNLFSVFFNEIEGVKEYRVQILYDIIDERLCDINMTIGINKPQKQILWHNKYSYSPTERFNLDGLISYLLHTQISNHLTDEVTEHINDILRHALPSWVEDCYDEYEHKQICLLMCGV